MTTDLLDTATELIQAVYNDHFMNGDILSRRTVELADQLERLLGRENEGKTRPTTPSDH